MALGDREVIDLVAVTARHGARDTLPGLDAADLAVLFEVHAVGSIGAAIAVFVRDLAGHAGLQAWLLRAEALGCRHAVIARARTGLAQVVGCMRTRLDAATHAVTAKAARRGIDAPARALVVVGTGQDALHGLGRDHVRLDHRYALVVGVLLVDKAVAVVVFAVADFSGKRALGRIGVVTVHIRVIAVAVAVHGARPVGDAVLRFGIAALVGSTREGLRIRIVAVQRHAVRVTARIGVGEAVAVHVAGLAAYGHWRTAVFRHAVTVRVLIRTAAALVGAQPSHGCRDRAATLLALQVAHRQRRTFISRRARKHAAIKVIAVQRLSRWLVLVRAVAGRVQALIAVAVQVTSHAAARRVAVARPVLGDVVAALLGTGMNVGVGVVAVALADDRVHRRVAVAVLIDKARHHLAHAVIVGGAVAARRHARALVGELVVVGGAAGAVLTLTAVARASVAVEALRIVVVAVAALVLAVVVFVLAGRGHVAAGHVDGQTTALLGQRVKVDRVQPRR